jgi:hypothetical protein
MSRTFAEVGLVPELPPVFAVVVAAIAIVALGAVFGRLMWKLYGMCRTGLWWE